jgi:hypothetical protein
MRSAAPIDAAEASDRRAGFLAAWRLLATQTLLQQLYDWAS